MDHNSNLSSENDRFEKSEKMQLRENVREFFQIDISPRVFGIGCSDLGGGLLPIRSFPVSFVLAGISGGIPHHFYRKMSK